MDRNNSLKYISYIAGPLTLLLAFYLAAPEVNEQKAVDVSMPIEVVGHNDVFGATQDLTFTVERTVTLSAIPDSMYIRASRLGYAFTDFLNNNQHLYDSKADFRLNGGDWIPINNETSSFFYPESKFTGSTGPIGGPWEVLQVMLPVSNATVGDNTLEFRFNGPKDNETSGYYVFDLDFQNSRTSPSVMSSDFSWPDYETWTPPTGYDDATSISEGQTLWTARETLWDNSVDQNIISASCADCHFRDGSELKHFNFSNQSIIARSVFHGLSETEGKQIAAYIRSRDLNYPSGYDLNNCGGRPWNPPYQPGPGVDSNNRPGKCWSAGAGAEWVMDNDWDAIPYLFPDAATRATIEGLTEIPQGPAGFEAIHGGPAVADLSPSSIRKEVHVDSLIRTADVPVAVQFPIIHEWWPRLHPADVLENPNDFWNSHQVTYENSAAAIANNRQSLIDAQASTSPRNSGTIHANQFAIAAKENWIPDGATIRSDQTPSLQFYSKSVWGGMKKWEIMWQNELEDLGDEIYRDHPLGLLGGRRLTWHQGGAGIYDMAPHKNQDDGRLEGPGPFSNRRTEQHYSTTWYQLSLMTESNQRGNQGNTSFDANYHHGHISFNIFNFGWREPVRYGITSTVWLYQNRNNYTGWRTGGWQHVTGWHGLHTHWPFRHLYRGAIYDNVPKSEMDAIREEMTRQWLQKSMQYHPNIWREQQVGDNNNSFGSIDDFFVYQPGQTIGSGSNKQQSYLNMVGTVATDHPTIAQSLVDSMAFWGQKMWPRVTDEFAQFHSTGFNNPTLAVTGIENGQVVDPADEFIINVTSDQPLDVIYVYRNGSRVETIDNPGTSVTDYNLGAAGEGVARWFVLGYTSDEISGYWGPVSTISDTGSLPDGWASTTLQSGYAARNISFDGADESFRIGRRGEGILGGRSQDDFPFLFRALTDDGSVSFRIKDLPDANSPWRGGGVTVRSALDVGATHMSWFLNPTNDEVRRVRRLNIGDNNNANNLTTIPAWGRIERDGGNVNFYGSADGASWDLIDTQAFPAGDIDWVGFWAANRDFQANSYWWEIDSVSLAGPAFAENPIAVNLTSPTSGAVFTRPANITLEASASSDGGNITEVRFLRGGNEIATVTDSPYTYVDEDVQEGSYIYTARAFDNAGNMRLSSPVSVSVASPPGWTTQELQSQERGSAEGSLTRLTDSAIELRASGFARGIYRKNDLNQFEAESETSCAAGDVIRFDIDEIQCPDGASWCRGGFRILAGDELLSYEILPLQNRGRILYASPRRSFPQEFSAFIGEEVVSEMRVRLFENELSGGGTEMEVRLEKKVGDDEFNDFFNVTMDGIKESCNWAFLGVSRVDEGEAVINISNISRN